MKTSTDHIVCLQSDLSLLCRHCGARYAPAMPMALDDYTALGNSFTKRHRSCQPRCSTCDRCLKARYKDGTVMTDNQRENYGDCAVTHEIIFEVHTHRCKDYKPRPVEQQQQHTS